MSIFSKSANFFWDSVNKRLGIGTASPGFLVDLLQTQNNNTALNIANKSNGNASSTHIRFENDGATGSTGAIIAKYSSGVTGQENYFFISQMASAPMVFSTAATERIRIDSSGNVGIGETSPGSKLHVVGDLRVTTAAAIAYHSNIAPQNGLALGTVSKSVAPSGGFGSISIITNDSTTTQIQATIDLVTSATAGDRRLRISAIEQGIGYRNITLAEAGGNVDSDSKDATLRIVDIANVVGSGGAIEFAASPAVGKYFAAIKGYLDDGNGNTRGSLRFYTRASTGATSLTECMCIDSTGALTQATTASARALTSYNNNASTPYGTRIQYTAASPNGAGSEFIYADDNAALRFSVKSNGGIANYQANDANLSDERVKMDIKPSTDYLAKINAIQVVTFKYKDQTHDDTNLGIIAQQVEAVAPEFVDLDGFGETPSDGIPLRAIYQTDLQYAMLKAIQELSAKNDALEARLAVLEGN